MCSWVAYLYFSLETSTEADVTPSFSVSTDLKTGSQTGTSTSAADVGDNIYWTIDIPSKYFRHVNPNYLNLITLVLAGEHAGSVLERRRIVSLSKTLYSPKVLVMPRKRWLRPDIAEKVLTETLNLDTSKQTLNLDIRVDVKIVKFLVFLKSFQNQVSHCAKTI